MSRRRRIRFHAWAIEANGGRLLSPRFFGLKVPAHLRGATVALFVTRAATRNARRSLLVQRGFPQARVRAVKVTVTVVRPMGRKTKRGRS